MVYIEISIANKWMIINATYDYVMLSFPHIPSPFFPKPQTSIAKRKPRCHHLTASVYSKLTHGMLIPSASVPVAKTTRKYLACFSKEQENQNTSHFEVWRLWGQESTESTHLKTNMESTG